ncbi:ferric iron uptake transcriptional regulator [uncultured Azohydromonas sp.]|jgi:Fe2+/Zn2+ uptake regulation proteins|uniref:ferric iron uptake transcriptional regulator n=1 Tax=uncultured Azohydromonas sp. TaxID=487342 RepID=UPI0026065372|nr:ferric iron uptake transcriptional regulator [uncultured Azohydromonas sp.]
MSKQPLPQADNLRTSGLKATLPRMRVLDVFKRADSRHLSAEDVYRELVNEGADIGLATVYRVLMQFEQAGLLSRSHFDTGKAVFELRQSNHHDHLVCVRCGRVEEFHDAEIEHRQRVVAETMGFELREHALTLYGLCSAPTCGGAEAGVKD